MKHIFAMMVALLAVLAIAPLWGAEEPSLGDYADLVRKSVKSTLAAKLSAKNGDTLFGVVTLVADDCFFIERSNEVMKIVNDAGFAAPKVGDSVRLNGNPSLEGGRVIFLARRMSIDGKHPLPAVRKVGVSDLVFIASRPEERAKDINWRLVEMKGRVIGKTDSGFAIDVDSMPVTVFCQELPGFLANCEVTRPIVSVVGVAELVLDQSSLIGHLPYVVGVKLRLSSVDGITLIPDLQYRLNCRDRRTRLLILAAFVALGVVLVGLVVFLVRQQRRQLRTHTLMTERKRMADDLHDTIEQHLVGAGMLLQLGKTVEAREILIRAKREMRDIVWGLKNDDMVRMTPAQMIREFARGENRKGLYRVDTRLNGLPEAMEANKMRDLSLIIREAIGNAVKHGGAKKIAIAADPIGGGGWKLGIANNGAPFDPGNSPGANEGHFGVEGMKERARRIGANLTIFVKGEWTIVNLEKKP